VQAIKVFLQVLSVLSISITFLQAAGQERAHSLPDSVQAEVLLNGGTSQQTSVGQSDSVTQMPLVAPIFIEDDYFTSTLVMVNASSVNTFADVVLSGMDGGELARKRVRFTLTVNAA
jgi:hypothetical protein